MKTKQFPKSTLTVALLAALGLGLAGCSDSDDDKDGSDGNPNPQGQIVTLDATQNAAYLDLATGQTVTEDGNWHLAYQRNVGFKVNGGTSGTGNVKACIAHQYDELYNQEGKPLRAEFEKLNADNTLASFNAVDVNDPNICTPAADTINTLIPTSGWYTYNSDPAAAGVVDVHDNSTNGWIVQSADGQSFARIRFSHFATRQYTMRLETELYDGSVWGAKQETEDINFTSGPVYWDLETNTVSTTEPENWELKFSRGSGTQSIMIQVNGGASGSGKAAVAGADKDGKPNGVGAMIAANVWDVTNPAPGAQGSGRIFRYFADSAEGAFSAPALYGALEYGGNFISDNDFNLWPTFATYFIEDNSNFYKLQIISNRGADGNATSGTLQVRYSDFSD